MGQKLSLQSAAKLLKLSTSRVIQLVNEGHIERDGKGQYDLIKIVHGYIDFLRENSITNVTGSMSLAEAKRRQMVAKANMAELEYAMEKASLVRAEDVEPQWEKLVITFRDKIRALPNRIAPLLLNQSSLPYIKEILTSQHTEALNELAKGEDIELIDSRLDDFEGSLEDINTAEFEDRRMDG